MKKCKGNWKCPYCKGIFPRRIDLIEHKRVCEKGPKVNIRYIIVDGKRKYAPGCTTWNAGHTGEDDPRLKAKGERLSERYRNGEIIPAWKGKRHSEKTKSKISASMKLAQSEGRAYNIGQCRWNNEHSWPEKWLIKVLDNEFDLKENEDYRTEFSFERFSLDFAWPTKKLCIEVDGKQHQTDNAQKLRDASKDKLLLENGWKELRIPWLECYRNPKVWIDKIREFLGE